MAMPAIQIIAETSSKQTLREFRLELASETISVRELLERRVRSEVAAYNEDPAAVFEGLVQPTESERVLNGYKLRRRRKLSADSQVEAAIAAFESNGFLLLVDERQVEDLDERVVIGPDTRARFVKLVPLMGG